MNEGNTCSHLEVKELKNIDHPIAHIYSLQYRLQDRLNKVPTKHTSLIEQISNVIYWRHCIHTECDELLDWFAESGAHKQELEMEVVDIMHFVFNMGIALGYDVDCMFRQFDRAYDYTLTDKRLSIDSTRAAICQLSKAISEMIDHLPWKTWKTYSDLTYNEDKVERAFKRVIQTNFLIAKSINMSFKRTIECYIAKNLENHARQDRGY